MALSLALGAAVVFGLAAQTYAAEKIKIGVINTPGSAPVLIARDKGYFAEEGLAADIVYFDAAGPITVAVAGGALDFGFSGTTGALFNLAAQGALRIIAGGRRDVPGFPGFAIVVSNQAWNSGLRSYAALGHRSFATTVGSPNAYSFALIEEKYRLDPKSIRIVPVPGFPAGVSAIIGGTADASVLPAVAAAGPIRDGKMKLLGNIADETPWQVAVTFTSTKMLGAHPALIERFLIALRKGTHAYDEAFVAADGSRKDGPTAPDLLQFLAKDLNQSIESVDQSLSYFDGDERLDMKDILHQIAWYRAQGMVKGTFDSRSMIDMRYVVPLPEK